MSLSFPKSKIQALLVGKSTFIAEPYLKKEGYRITKAEVFSPALLEKANLLICEQDIKLSATPSKLLCVGYWNKYDLAAPALIKSGVVAFNSPFSDARSEAEHALLFLLQLARQQSIELKGKRIGIIGYSHGGATLSLLLENLGMDIFYWDNRSFPPIGKATPIKQMQELMRKADMVTITSDISLPGFESDCKHLKKESLLVTLQQLTPAALRVIREMLASNKLSGFAMETTEQKIYDQWSTNKKAVVTLNRSTQTVEAQHGKAEALSENLIRFINSGSTLHSINFPELQLPDLKQSHRFIHIHHNRPGVLAKINSILAQHGLNITGQYLKTNDAVGYVITDVAKEYDDRVIKALKDIKETIRFRVLY
jgi:D-3-phosphoglycerate dehydrogenase